MLLAAGSSDAALAFVEIGALVLGLALLSRVAGRFGISAIPLYLLAGLSLGEGGFVQLDVSLEFFEIAAEIGVLLLLFALGLEHRSLAPPREQTAHTYPSIFSTQADNRRRLERTR